MPSTSEEKSTKFVKSVDSTASKVTNPADPSKREPARPKERIRASDAEKSKIWLSKSSKKEFVVITKKKTPNASDRNVNITHHHHKGILRISNVWPTTPFRRSNAPYPKSNVNQIGWNNGPYNDFQTPNFGPWNYLHFVNHMNGLFNTNGPMRYWGPNAWVSLSI